MALRGSLSDLNIVELVQVPAAGRKTGELFIAGLEGIARLYYLNGRLVHLETDELSGHDVLVEVIGWTEGEFEFRADVTAEETTFDSDLHRALMLALKERDERRQAAAAPASDESGGRRHELLREFVAAHEFLRSACLLGEDGSAACRGHGEAAEPAWFAELRRVLSDLMGTYPRAGLQRVLFEDDEGTVVMSRLADGTALVVAATSGTTLGAVSVAVERFARVLAGEPREGPGRRLEGGPGRGDDEGGRG